MTSTYVDWGGQNVKLTWRHALMPEQSLITSVHGFCFRNGELLMVNLNDRGWDFPGGHLEREETTEACFKREAMEEAYVEGDCTLLGALEVSHANNPLWAESSPYPKIGYQVFYRMDITKIHTFKGEFESVDRLFIEPEQVATYYKSWHNVYETIMNDAKRKCLNDHQKTGSA